MYPWPRICVASDTFNNFFYHFQNEPFSKFQNASEAENESSSIAEKVAWTTPPQSMTKPLKIGVLGVPPHTPSDRRGARILASRGPKLISNGKTRLTLSPLYRVGGGRALAPRYWRNLASEFVVVLLLVTAPDGGSWRSPPPNPTPLDLRMTPEP